MRMSKTNLVMEVAVAILVFGLLFFLVWAAYRPASGRSQVSLRFLRFTNDAANVPHTVFAITNLGMTAVYCDRPAVIDMIYEGTNCPPWHAMLGGGASTTLMMPVPTNLPLWILRLEADPDVGLISSLRHHLPRAPAGPLPYEIYSDWVTNPPPP